MARKQSNRPTDAELAILRVLWRQGPSTVKAVHDALGSSSGVGYTTVLKTLQIMTEKNLVQRDESQRAHVYAAASSEDETQKQLVGDLLERAFEGSARKLVMQALASKRADEQELQEIRKLIEEMSREEDRDDA